MQQGEPPNDDGDAPGPPIDSGEQILADWPPTVSDEQVVLGAILANHPDVLRACLASMGAAALGEWCHPARGSLLHVAAAAGALHCLALLLEEMGDAQVNSRDGSGLTPLFVALLRGHDLVAELLLRAAPSLDVNVLCGEDCETALQVAVERDKPELVRLLMERGADPSLTDMHGENAFGRAESPELLALLCGHGFATAALFHGCESGAEPLVAAALAAGADARCVTGAAGRTAAMVAATQSTCPAGVIRRLLEAGCEVEAECRRGRTALVYAAHANNVEAARELLRRGAGRIPEALDEARRRGHSGPLVALLEHPPKKRRQKPIEFVRERLAGELSAECLAALPRKWHLVGDVLLLQGVAAPLLALDDATLERVGLAYLEAPQIRAASVLLERASPHGELRRPHMQLIAGRRDTLTRHTEDGVRFWIDPARIMFCSGNGTERMHFRRGVLLGPDELVVDMFAGVGYFAIPLALSEGRHRPRRVVALEKNPESAALLRRNAAENGVEHVLEVCEGDNRQVGEAYVGRASRVVMGYIPTPVQFIARALAFLSPEAGGVIHYHFVGTRDEAASLPRAHLEPEVARTRFRLGAIAVRTVKDYAPQLFHFVANVQIDV